MTESERSGLFERERAHLLCVAFRILGSEADAEDVVQETWIKYDGANPSAVRNLQAWLTTIATRLCIDVLRRRHETPTEGGEMRAGNGYQPEETALLADELLAAFAVVLDELTPPQRVALVLHDAFGVEFKEIGHILGTTAASAKKMASRARGRVRHRTVVPREDNAKAWAVVEAFMHAAQQGNIEQLVALLDPHVVRTADPQALPPHGSQTIRGAEAVATETRALRDKASRARVSLINGRPGIVVGDGSAIEAVIVLRIVDGRIAQYDVIADPQRVALLHLS